MKIKSTFSAPMLVIFVIILMVASRYIELDSLAYNENICLAVIVLQLMLLVVPSAFYIKLKGSGFTSRLRFSPLGVEKLIITLLSTLTLIVGDTFIRLLLYRFGEIESTFSIYKYYLNGIQPNVLYSLVTFALVPAITEEFLFRSVLCAEYESSGVFSAMFATSALYAMFGMSFESFPIYFFSGLIFALVMYLTKSVFASMLCHLIYSSFQLAASETVWRIITKPQSMGFLIFALSSLLLICLVGLFGECERIYYSFAISNEKSDFVKSGAGPKSFSQALLAPPFLVAVLVFIVAAIQFT